jgi:hypothetical protein
VPEPSGAWFAAREDGLGWRPRGVGGWLSVLFTGLLLVLDFARLALTARSLEELFGVFLPQSIGLLLTFFCLCLYTGETLPALQGRVWFKAKRFGWGWTPSQPEGWIVIGLFLAAILGSQLALVKFRPPTPAVVAEHLAFAFGLVAVVIAICWKTGEKPSWRWG